MTTARAIKSIRIGGKPQKQLKAKSCRLSFAFKFDNLADPHQDSNLGDRIYRLRDRLRFEKIKALQEIADRLNLDKFKLADEGKIKLSIGDLRKEFAALCELNKSKTLNRLADEDFKEEFKATIEEYKLAIIQSF